MSYVRLLDICFARCKVPVIALLFHFFCILELQCVGIFPGFLYTDLSNFPSLYWNCVSRNGLGSLQPVKLMFGSEMLFKRLHLKVTKGTVLSFNNRPYKQVDGCGMGILELINNSSS